MLNKTISQKEFLEQIKSSNAKIIGIDGRCGSGKTTLSNILSQNIDCDIIHMDDFFLPLGLRTSERLAECGGNVHYERFLEQVILGIKSKKQFFYQKFDCKKMDFDYNINVSNQKIIIVEGAYTLRPEFRDIFDLKVFMNISKEEQKNRIVARNGIDDYKNFETKWIPKEEAYFEKFKILEHCDLIILD